MNEYIEIILKKPQIQSNRLFLFREFLIHNATKFDFDLLSNHNNEKKTTLRIVMS